MIKLQFRQDPSRYVKLMSKGVSIGRDSNNTLVIDDPSVSDFHAEIIRDDNQQLCVVDLLSAAGTYVNDEQISGRCLLSAWDRIRVGQVELEINDPNIRRPDEWALCVQSDLLTGQFYTLKPKTVVGRDPSCDLTIDNKLLSRRHTELIIENDKLRVVDLHSGNGTYLNGEKVSNALASPGDEIRFDQQRFIIRGPTKTPTSVADCDDPEVTMLRPAAGLGLAAPGLANTGEMPANSPTDNITEPVVPLVAITEQTRFLKNGQFFIRGNHCTIGREEKNDIVLADGTISKHHVTISYIAGEWHIEDQNSRNGMRINGESRKSAVLADGDLIALGRVEFRFRFQ